jgi:hypothetical protein
LTSQGNQNLLPAFMFIFRYPVTVSFTIILFDSQRTVQLPRGERGPHTTTIEGIVVDAPMLTRSGF